VKQEAKMKFRSTFLLIFCMALTSAWAEELVMIEEQGCQWCERWNAEIAAIYPKTAEGKFAPLRRVDISELDTTGLSFASRPHFTPTFVLISENAELARIEGYPGEDFFWGLLEQILIEKTAFKRSAK
jgi:hypothetical protein